MPRVVTYERAAEFLQTVMPLLVPQEAQNNLILGFAMRYAKNPALEKKLLFAVVQENEAIILAVLLTDAGNLFLSALEDNAIFAVHALADFLYQGGYQINGVNAQVNLAEQFGAIWSHRMTLQPVIKFKRALVPFKLG